MCGVLTEIPVIFSTMGERGTTEVCLRGEDEHNLRQILEHRFPPPKAGRPTSLRSSRISVLDREETPWWWSPSVDTEPYQRESKVLDANHLLSSEMLARSLALSAQRARDKMYSFVESLAKQRGEDFDEMLDAWDGFGLDFMPRIPKQPGSPPDASYFYKAKIEKDIQNIHIVLQYFAVLLEEIMNDQERFNSPTKTKWVEMAEILKQLLREVDVLLAALELPRRRVPRSALPQYARGLSLREAREARDWLAARDLLNAVELLWHVFSVFAAAADARREAQLRASNTALARFGSTYNYGRPADAHSTPRREGSASQIILPYARLSPVPGRPVAATQFLYGLTRDPMTTPYSSPASCSGQQVDFVSHFSPHAAQSVTSSQLDSPCYPPAVYLSFDLPRSLSPPSPRRRESPPPSTAVRYRHPRSVIATSPPRRGSPPGDVPADSPAAHTHAHDAVATTCCMPPPTTSPLPPIAGPHRDLFSPPPTRSTAGSASQNHPPPVPSCCLPPPKTQFPPPFLSHLVSP